MLVDPLSNFLGIPNSLIQPNKQRVLFYEMDQQQALILKELQRPLVLDKRPIPEPTGNQVLVRIITAGSMIRGYTYLHERKLTTHS